MSGRTDEAKTTASHDYVPLRRTRQRSAVGELLRDSSDFRTALQVFDSLRANGDRIGLTTVYRTLQAMTESGELDVIRTAEGEAAYRRCSTSHHHHLVCRQCHATVELSGPAVERWASKVARENNYADARHHVEVSGVCGDCVTAGRTR